MKIKTYGYRHLTDQITRIEQGFKILGHDLVQDPKEADLIYLNDRTFENLEILNNTKAKKIFNILDVPIFKMSEHEILRWKTFLKHADKITCISDTVKKDIKKYFGFDSYIIYNPSKDLQSKNLKSDIPRMLFVGRANESTKRFSLVKSFFSYYNLDDRKLLFICGKENPGFGNYLGVVSDEELNYQYNLSNIILCPSSFEGIGLPLIEALICNKMPIACFDNETAKEFLPEWFLCEPNIFSINEKIRDYFKAPQKYDKLIKELGNKYKEQFNKVEVAKKILTLIS
jgi:glycosyltransferase involved in cell wall biosynthesis